MVTIAGMSCWMLLTCNDYTTLAVVLKESSRPSQMKSMAPALVSIRLASNFTKLGPGIEILLQKNHFSNNFSNNFYRVFDPVFQLNPIGKQVSLTCCRNE
jgi:hypothetical protein